MLTKSLVFSLLAFAACATAQADVTVINSYDATLRTGGFTNSGFSMGTYVAESFVTGSSILTLSNVVFPQVAQTGTGVTAVNSDGFSAGETFSLYSDSALSGTNQPAVSQFNFTLQNDTTVDAFKNPGAFGETTATVPLIDVGLATLLPNTRYWLVLANTSNVAWNYINTYTYASAQGYTIPGMYTSITRDSDGEIDINSNDGIFGDGPQQFALNVAGGNAIPEPSTYCLMAVTGLALVVSRKRTRRLA